MKKMYTSRLSFSFFCKGLIVLLVLTHGFVTGFSQTNNYFGTSGVISGTVWNTNPAGPYNLALVTTGGPILNFNNAGTATGATITSVVGINFGASMTWTAGGTIGAAGIILPIDVAPGVEQDLGTQSFSTSATAGYTKNGTGGLAMAGNTYGGGFTLNAGTIIARGTNTFGGNATPGALIINGGTISANATRTFAGKLSGITVSNNFTFGATTGLSLPGANLTFDAPVSLGAAATRIITIGGTGIYTLGGAISGVGSNLSIASTAAGTILLTGGNTYTGTTTITGGTLRLNKTGGTTLPITNNVIINGGTLQISSDQTLNNLVLASGATLTVDAGITLTINGIFFHNGGTINGTGVIAYGAGATLSYGDVLAQTTTAFEFPVTAGPTNLIINNPGGVILNLVGGRTIPPTGNLALNNGILTTTTLLTLDAGSAYSGGSNASYIDGKIQKIGNTDFTFPVGKPIFGTKAMVPIGVSNFSGFPATTAFTAEYIRGDATALGAVTVGINHVSSKDYWTLDNTGTGTPTVNVTAYWTNESTLSGSAGYIDNLSKLIIAHFNGSVWDNFGGLGTFGPSTTTAGSLTWASVSAFSPFSLASIDISNPLPIAVNYIKGIKQTASNILNWQVSCVNNISAKMILERSADNKTFTEINTITATALRCQQPFDFTDNSPLSGVNYYRLKTINDDGKVVYSTTIALLNKDAGFDMVNLLPNMVSSDAILNITSAQKTKLNIVITDVAGRQVQQAAYSLIAGSNQFSINVASLAAGTYHITGYTAEGISKTLRFVKQ